ncbi:MAG: hypothetical protein Q4A04_01595 [Eubacteriales bacterium]|nr:hypothetical protein [Eubacteriales bacterium]
MKHRLKNKLNTVVELTSLLDVIFIVLMIVICNQQINLEEKGHDVETAYEEAAEVKAEAEAALSEAEDLRAEAEAEKALFEEHLEKFEDVSSQMTTVTVIIDYQPSNLRTRTIRLVADADTPETITITPETENDAYTKFEEKLEDLVTQAEASDKPVVISIDMTRILYRDELRAEEVLSAVYGRHGNLFYRKSAEK